MTCAYLAGSVGNMTLLTRTEIADALEDLPGWGGDTSDIRCRYIAPDFRAAIGLVNAVADAAEEAGHHPAIDIRWKDVLFVLTTHSQDGVTGKDVELASTIARLADEAGASPA